MISIVVLREIVTQGGILGLVTIAAFITSRVIRIDDLTLEGSFSAGSGLVAALVHASLPLVVALPVSFFFGGFLGIGTGLLHERLGINNVLSGLCMTALLFSVNLAMVGAYASIPAAILPHFFKIPMPLIVLLVLVMVYGVVATLLKSSLGLCMVASGYSPTMVQSFGRNPAFFKIAALAIANGIAALAGALFAFHTGFYSITGNVGILIGALSGLLIGSVMNARFSVWLLVGALAQQVIFAVIISAGLNPVWNTALKAVLIIVLVAGFQTKERN